MKLQLRDIRAEMITKARDPRHKVQLLYKPSSERDMESLRCAMKTLKLHCIPYILTFNRRTSKYRININPSLGFRQHIAETAYIVFKEEG